MSWAASCNRPKAGVYVWFIAQWQIAHPDWVTVTLNARIICHRCYNDDSPIKRIYIQSIPLWDKLTEHYTCIFIQSSHQAQQCLKSVKLILIFKLNVWACCLQLWQLILQGFSPTTVSRVFILGKQEKQKNIYICIKIYISVYGNTLLMREVRGNGLADVDRT